MIVSLKSTRERKTGMIKVVQVRSKMADRWTQRDVTRKEREQNGRLAIIWRTY